MIPARLLELQAVSISRRAHGILQGARLGVVVATFPRSCYADLDGRIVAFVHEDLGNGPLNVVVAGRPPFTIVAPGTPLTVKGEQIHFGSTLAVLWGGAEIWEAGLPPWGTLDPGRLALSLTAAQEVLLAEAPAESFARLLGARGRPHGPHPRGFPGGTGREGADRAARAREGMGTLREGLERRSLAHAVEAARALGGLGPGLTPAGDDVLAGALLALAVLLKEGEGLREAIATTASRQTTRISAAYLEAARMGEASEAWHRLLDMLPGGDRTAIALAARKVMAFGETSGADTLAGFLLAMEAILGRATEDFRGSLENTASNCTAQHVPNPMTGGML